MHRTFEKKYSGESDSSPKYSVGDMVTVRSPRHPLHLKHGKIEKVNVKPGNVFYDVIFDKVTKHLPERMLFLSEEKTEETKETEEDNENQGN